MISVSFEKQVAKTSVRMKETCRYQNLKRGEKVEIFRGEPWAHDSVSWSMAT